MFVYRIESQHGIGPYNNGGFCHIALNDASHPIPSADGIHGFVPEKYLCGFKSMEQLLEWFDEDALKELYEINQDSLDGQRLGLQGVIFHIAIYTVAEDCIMFGQRQLVFEHKKTECIATMPIEHAQKILEKQNQWLDIPPKWCIM